MHCELGHPGGDDRGGHRDHVAGAKEKYPEARPRILSDNEPQFIAKDFKECIRPGTPLSLDDARRLVSRYVDHYNSVRLNSATGYLTPKDMLTGRQQEIHAERDRKLEEARMQRQIRRQHGA